MRWLAPLGAAFGAITRRRASLYARGLLPAERLRGPVISIGNLSVGGSGKTPVVAHLARALQAAGRDVAVLSRGYKGHYREHARIVADGRTVAMSAHEAGDEPVMLARMLPGVVVAVGRRRADAGRLVEQRFGERLHLLDDGFQHLALPGDLDLVCVRAEDLVDRPLPAGRLREPPSALARAQVLLAMDDEAVAAELRRAHPQVHLVRRRPIGVIGLDGTSQPLPARPLLLSAIAGPERFEADARALCPGVVGALRFRDHYHWSDADLLKIWIGSVQKSGADAILTTAKDAVRLPPTLGDLPVRVLAQSLEIEDEPRLLQHLLSVGR